MRISSKGRYGLAAMISIAQLGHGGDSVTVISISDKLGISKIYLEQVFALLKRANLVVSVKGSQGGYHLPRTADKITAYEILQAAEVSLFEKTDASVSGNAEEIDKAMNNLVWTCLDSAVEDALKKVTLADLVSEAESHKAGGSYMFYI